MISKVTKGIQVSVETKYREKQSDPSGRYYLFSYFITIENNTDDEVQLMRRHWQITDSSGEYREVEGAGVVGEQPVIRPGQKYEYESSCNFTTEIGKMKGTYTLERLNDRTVFQVEIPEFIMIIPSKLN